MSMKNTAKTDKGVPVRGGGPVARGGGVVVRGPWVPDFTSLEATDRVVKRGWDLFSTGAVHPLPLYPWIFHVTGSAHDTGTKLYTVDLEAPGKPTCGCAYFQNTLRVCKHIVAAVAWVGERGKDA